jgi:hypothetical protein
LGTALEEKGTWRVAENTNLDQEAIVDQEAILGGLIRISAGRQPNCHSVSRPSSAAEEIVASSASARATTSNPGETRQGARSWFLTTKGLIDGTV